MPLVNLKMEAKLEALTRLSLLVIDNILFLIWFTTLTVSSLRHKDAPLSLFIAIGELWVGLNKAILAVSLGTESRYICATASSIISTSDEKFK